MVTNNEMEKAARLVNLCQDVEHARFMFKHLGMLSAMLDRMEKGESTFDANEEERFCLAWFERGKREAIAVRPTADG